MIAVTLNSLCTHHIFHDRCMDSWQRLINSLVETQIGNMPVSIEYILDTVGIEYAIWSLRALPDHYDSAVRLLVCDLVEPAIQHTSDQRLGRALQVARDYAHGKASEDVIAEAWDLACEALQKPTSAVNSAAAHAVRWATVNVKRFAGDDIRGPRHCALHASRAAASAVASHATDTKNEHWVTAWKAARAEQESILRKWLGSALIAAPAGC